MWFKKKSAPTVHTVHVKVPTVDFHRALAVLGVRQGMWVMTTDGVGVVKSGNPHENTLVVALANSDGTNRLDVVCPASTVRQSTYLEIPAPRRAGLSVSGAASMGYL